MHVAVAVERLARPQLAGAGQQHAARAGRRQLVEQRDSLNPAADNEDVGVDRTLSHLSALYVEPTAQPGSELVTSYVAHGSSR